MTLISNICLCLCMYMFVYIIIIITTTITTNTYVVIMCPFWFLYMGLFTLHSIWTELGTSTKDVWMKKIMGVTHGSHEEGEQCKPIIIIQNMTNKNLLIIGHIIVYISRHDWLLVNIAKTTKIKGERCNEFLLNILDNTSLKLCC